MKKRLSRAEVRIILDKFNPSLSDIKEFFKTREKIKTAMLKEGNAITIDGFQKQTHCHGDMCNGHEFGKFEKVMLMFNERFCQKCIKAWHDKAYEARKAK